MSEDMHEKEPVPPLQDHQNRHSGNVLRKFQDSIAQNIVYDTRDFKFELAYLSAGLNEEAGETSGKIKKFLRGDYPLEFLDYELALVRGPEDITAHNEEVAERRMQTANELGDTLWYLTRLAHKLGFSLEAIMEMNMQKLAERKQRGTIQGDGDHR